MRTCIRSTPEIHEKERAALVALRPWIVTYVRLRVAACDVDDVAQEVFAQAIKSLEAFDPSKAETDQLRRWVAGVARLTVAMHLRAQRYRERREDAYRHERQWSTPSAEGAHGAREILAILQRATLPILWRTWADYTAEGLTVEEIAKRDGISEGTVHNRIRLARRDFAAALAREEAIENGPAVRRK
jgi:RNA polymerase sigma-70 factor (ECF subfamily)